jgi:hypothetical protein
MVHAKVQTTDTVQPELTLNQMLADDIVRLMMTRDGVTEDDVRLLFAGRGDLASQRAREGQHSAPANISITVALAMDL